MQKLNSQRSEEMVQNIKNSQKLFILVDHENTDEVKNWIEKRMKKLNLTDIQLSMISPKYGNLTTILNEYQEEQSDFDPEKLAQRIVSKL